MHERVIVLSLSVSQSVILSFCHTDLEDDSLLKIETSIKMLHWTSLMAKIFSFDLFQKKLVIIRPYYDRKQLLVMPPIVTPYSYEQIIFCCP